MTYQIILDQEKLLQFIDWLPELGTNEKFYCCLFARKKYFPNEVKAPDKAQLKRFLSDKSRLFEKIRQLEAPLGAYKIKNIEVPPEALALYINPNPRDLKKAAFDSIIQLADSLKKDKIQFNPHAEVMSCIQRSKGKQYYVDFDIDQKDFDFEPLKEIINLDCLKILETRGGFHLLVELARLNPAFKKSYYNNIKALGVDQTGDQLLPVPGTIQGGFVPQFVDLAVY